MEKKKTKIRGIFSRFSRDRLISDSSRSSFLCSNSNISRKEKRTFIQRTFSRFSPVPGRTFNLSLFEATNSAFFRKNGRKEGSCIRVYIYISVPTGCDSVDNETFSIVRVPHVAYERGSFTRHDVSVS